jgi:hypothetical protein
MAAIQAIIRGADRWPWILQSFSFSFSLQAGLLFFKIRDGHLNEIYRARRRRRRGCRREQ